MAVAARVPGKVGEGTRVDIVPGICFFEVLPNRSPEAAQTEGFPREGGHTIRAFEVQYAGNDPAGLKYALQFDAFIYGHVHFEPDTTDEVVAWFGTTSRIGSLEEIISTIRSRPHLVAYFMAGGARIAARAVAEMSNEALAEVAWKVETICDEAGPFIWPPTDGEKVDVSNLSIEGFRILEDNACSTQSVAAHVLHTPPPPPPPTFDTGPRYHDEF